MPREIALLVNPASGKGRGERTAAVVVPRLREAGFSVRELDSRDADQARALAGAALAEGVESLVVVGGDGMVHLAVQELAGTSVNLGIVPAGTGNDAARALGIPLHDPQAAADVVVASRVRRVDLARAGDAFVLCVLSAGIDSLVNERADRMRWPRGPARYTLATLAELRRFAPRRYTLVEDGVERHVEALLVAVGNGPSFGGGLRITEGASLDDGLLDVVVFGPVGTLELARTYPKLWSGRHTRHPAYSRHQVREVRIEAEGVLAYGDGERLGPLPLTVRVEPGALRVLAGREHR